MSKFHHRTFYRTESITYKSSQCVGKRRPLAQPHYNPALSRERAPPPTSLIKATTMSTSSWIFLSQDSNNNNREAKLVILFISLAASLTMFFVIFFGRHLLRGWRITTASTPRDSPKTKLAPSTIASLPTFAYQKAIDRSGNGTSVQCAVCLGQAQEGEMLRQLPKCKHLFHLECIDMWLYSHSTCPLCRSVVVDSPKAVEKVEVGEPSAPPESPV